MSWLDQKYVMLLGPSLRNFKQKSGNLWNFSCPLCGDSEKNKFKARGYVYQKGGEYVFHCHNCGQTKKFVNFLKQINQQLYYDYVREKLLDERPELAEKPAEPVYREPLSYDHAWLQKLKKISQLSPDHPAKMYVVDRMIPPEQHYRLFYCPRFFEFTNSLLPNKFPRDPNKVYRDEPRLIIPFIDEHGNAFGYQGRSFDPKIEKKAKYYTIMLEERPGVWGLDTLDRAKPYFAFEGPIDAMFVPNSIATLGGIIQRDLKDLNLSVDKLTVVYDNEPRNPDVVKHMEDALRGGLRVVIWPDYFEEKDVNEMVRERVKADPGGVIADRVKRISMDVRRVMEANAREGVDGLTTLGLWRRDR